MEVDFLSAFGAGSGVNTTEVVGALVDAERAARQLALDRVKESATLKISAYGLVKSSLTELKSAFDKLNDVRDLKSFSVSNTQSTNIGVSATADATSGSYEISVSQRAASDSFRSGSYASEDVVLNSGADLSLTFTTAAGSNQLVVSSPTPSAIVTSINDANLGYTATLLNTGDASNPYVITITGATGADSAFSVSSDSGDVDLTSRLTTAVDAQLSLNGVSVSRSTNEVTDLITGVTFSLNNAGFGTAEISVNSDTSAAASALRNLATVYNASVTLFDELGALEKTEDELVGSLNSDSTFRTLRSSLRNVLTSLSSTASGNIQYLSHIGLSMTREGTLEIDETKMANALTNDFSDVITALTADTNDQTPYGDFSRGIAGDGSALIENMIKSTGSVATAIQNSETKLEDYEVRLAALDQRMALIRERYIKQFSAMQRIVDQMNSTSEYLTNQFKALNNSD